MHYVISFETGIFDINSERENSINPIRGLSVGEWFKPRLESNGVAVDEIKEEDWGWYSLAEYRNKKYLLGFIALIDEIDLEDPEIIVQVDKERTFIETILGKNKIDQSDEIIVMIKSIIDTHPDFVKVKEEGRH